MLKVELKRILKTRSTWWLTGIALVLCLIFAFWAVNMVTQYNYNYNGKEAPIKGVQAYELNKEQFSVIEGEVMPELFAEAISKQQALDIRYGSDYSLPLEIDRNVTEAFRPVYQWIVQSFTDESGAMLSLEDIPPEKAQNFYSERLLTLERLLENNYKNAPQVVSYAMPIANAGETNFNYSYGIGSTDAFSILEVCVFLIMLICVVITAPIFSSDYASGADDILRCTKYGRKRLAVTKLGSAMLIGLGVFALCIAAYILVVYSAFGFSDTTSMELLRVMFNPDALDARGCLGMIILSSTLTFFAMSCFTLFLSSRISNPIIVLAVSIAIALIPTVMLLTGVNSNVLNWIRFCLPSGGVTLAGSMLTELKSLRFLWIGDFVTWSPYVMLVAAAVQIPIWFGLSVRAYDKHEAI